MRFLRDFAVTFRAHDVFIIERYKTVTPVDNGKTQLVMISALQGIKNIDCALFAQFRICKWNN